MNRTFLPRRSALVTLTAAAFATFIALPARAYDEKADAPADVARALEASRRSGRPVLLVFGANWCGDCRALEKALAPAPTAKWLADTFEVVKVDVGNFNRNLDLAKAYGDPIRKGIPAAVIVDADRQVRFATRAGELANARSMGDEGIVAFLKDAAGQAKAVR